MFCENCGAKMDDDSRFCEKCGAKIEIENQADTEVNSMVKVRQDATQNPENSVEKYDEPKTLGDYEEQGLKNILTNVSSTLKEILRHFEKLSKCNDTISFYEKKYNSIGGVFKSTSDEFLPDEYKRKFWADEKNVKMRNRISVLNIASIIAIPLAIFMLMTVEVLWILSLILILCSVIWWIPVMQTRAVFSNRINISLGAMTKEVIEDMKKEAEKINSSIESFEPVIQSPPVSLILKITVTLPFLTLWHIILKIWRRRIGKSALPFGKMINTARRY